jgi:hypothetical protein
MPEFFRIYRIGKWGAGSRWSSTLIVVWCVANASLVSFSNPCSSIFGQQSANQEKDERWNDIENQGQQEYCACIGRDPQYQKRNECDKAADHTANYRAGFIA